MPVYLDAPGDQLAGKTFAVSGWAACHATSPAIGVRVGGSPVPFSLCDRPDVRAAMAGFPTIVGINALAHLVSADFDDPVLVELECDGEIVSRICRAPPGAAGGSTAQADLRMRSRAWCMARLRCPACFAARDRLSPVLGGVTCADCGVVYRHEGGALNMISASAGIAAGVMATENVSSNPYTPDALDLIERTTRQGGWVLDCGAGSRPERLAGVVNVEIVDYPSTDVLAVGESLPFADNSFDAVLSLAVLEHVRDPFACARELVRVLRPGGELLADVPFLQPLHGYPDHYYNMTQAGLRNLFAGLGKVVDCWVPLHGHPIFAMQWMLGAYLGGLPDEARAQLAAMTVGEVASLRPHEFLPYPPAIQLPQEVQSIVGCLNTLRLRK